MPVWTNEQLDAISANENDILVSAAAGSGKTAVLTERIAKLLTDSKNPLSPSELLVVTFTNAAASEMRERIILKLTEKMELEPENKLIQDQLAQIGSAAITTIHSFCLNMIRENFILAGVDPAFKIADTTENDLLKLESIREASDEMYEDPEFSDGFIKLSESYSQAKNMDSFLDLASGVYNFVMSLPDPIKWLDKSAEMFKIKNSFDETVHAELICENTKNTLKFIISEYNSIIKKAENDSDVPAVALLLKDERQKFKDALLYNSYTEFYSFFSTLSFKNFPQTKKEYEPIYREEIKAVRDNIKTKASSLSEKFFNISSEKQAEVFRSLYPCVLAFSEFIKRIIKRFDEKKEKKNILNFNDLEHICYRLFVDEYGNRTNLAEKTAERFSEILIDEYQDTSRLQESIFSAIHSKNRLFMVGDIKQSIYRFRNTDPLLFRDKSESFSKEKGSKKRKILLSKNFRSRENVLSSVNFLFLRLMSEKAGEIDYNEDEMLNIGGKFAECLNPLPFETEVNIIDKKLEYIPEEDEDTSEDLIMEMSTAEIEAEHIADKIEELISEGYLVSGKEDARKICYRDICILMRSTKNTAEIFSEVLANRGIPVFSDTAGGFFESGEIDTVMSILKIIDNPHQDIPLISVLRSPVYNFTTNELATIRSSSKKCDFYDALVSRSVLSDELGEKISDFLRDLSFYRLRAKTLMVHELIWEIYSKSGIYDFSGATKGGNIKQANLKNLYVRASEFDKSGFKGLYSFISFMEEYHQSGSDFSSAKLISEEHDVVRIMSIHKSKGLEFPVVILASCGKKFNTEEKRSPFLYHPNFGYGPKYVDSVLRVSYPTGARSAILSVLTEEALSEEMRILYVALTRAKEKLIISGTLNNLQSSINKWKLGEDGEFKIAGKRALSASSYLDWIGMCLLNHPDGSPLKTELTESFKIFDDKSKFKINILPPYISPKEKSLEKENTKENEADIEEVLSLVNSEYPYKESLGIPSKITVTELKRRVLEEEAGVNLYKTAFTSPAFQTLSGAERGTALHTFMEHADFSGDISENGLLNQANVLYKKGFLTENEKNCLDILKLQEFFKSDLFKKIRSSKEIKREVMFAVKEKAKRLGIANSDSPVLVQGVIDLVLINDDEITIIDYKTDKNLSPEDATQKYRVQLVCYNMAVEKLFGKKAKHAYIYLFDTGKTAFVSLDEAFLSERFDENKQL